MLGILGGEGLEVRITTADKRVKRVGCIVRRSELEASLLYRNDVYVISERSLNCVSCVISSQ